MTLKRSVWIKCLSPWLWLALILLSTLIWGLQVQPSLGNKAQAAMAGARASLASPIKPSVSISARSVALLTLVPITTSPRLDPFAGL